MLRVRKPKGFTFFQLALVSALGVFGGAYIYQPLILDYINGTSSKDKPKTDNKPESGK